MGNVREPSISCKGLVSSRAEFAVALLSYVEHHDVGILSVDADINLDIARIGDIQRGNRGRDLLSGQVSRVVRDGIPVHRCTGTKICAVDG